MPFEVLAPALHGPAMSAQHWDNLTFLHWPVEPARIARFFPPGVRPDALDGVSYVGLVPFQMRGAGPGRLPVGYFGSFAETNVRLYSVDDQDRHGIVFLTLEASRLATVLLARASLGLPYTWSAMEVSAMKVSATSVASTAASSGDTVSYTSHRRWPDRASNASTTVRVRLGAEVTPTATETWLTSRWGLHTRVAGRTIWVPNEHGPWPLRSAELLELDNNLVAACGIEVTGAELLRPLWSPGVRTTFGWPSRVHGGGAEPVDRPRLRRQRPG
ncbi:MAG: DUF2071 domain-containing protein [Jatrophihabitantaceae bacterium]